MFAKITKHLLRLLDNQRVLSALRKQPLPFSSWQHVRQLACISYLTSVEKSRLRILTAVLLQQKIFIGEQGLNLDDGMKVLIAAQACVPILKLGLNYYSGFVQVSVYPTAFWVERDESDEAGIVHHKKVLLSGESWSRGPVILSWDEIKRDMHHQREGHNVVIHEFAHKIDMLNQGANGMPPIPAGSSTEEWVNAFEHAYTHLLERLEHHHKTCINTYGATSQAEYFAVVSEYFFTAPQHLIHCSHQVYIELKKFYQQDPAKRLDAQKKKKVKLRG
ncbi:Putative inner membrane protein [hydrothermal vent metagenome]|uniref:Inner membrane protein n=1 Tax=hydrothermal vent metagenome TaxID=652676 RepID=A0A3B0YJV5_9ZZZZ